MDDDEDADTYHSFVFLYTGKEVHSVSTAALILFFLLAGFIPFDISAQLQYTG